MTGHAVTRYTVHSPKVTKPVTLAVVSDLHNGDCRDVLEEIRSADAVLMPGDMVDRHHYGMGNLVELLLSLEDRTVFFSRGNHELKSPEGGPAMALAKRLGVHMVDDRVERFGELAIAGQPAEWTLPEGKVLGELEKADGFRLLMCHHPEYYEALIQGHDIDLCIAGHAHGGQVQIGGRGLFAPGQGVFPKYTDGFYDHDKLLVSRGMTNSARAPRFGNPCELVMLTIEP